MLSLSHSSRSRPRLLADTVWLISFHDLINHSISARRRISGILKASDRHQRRAVMTPATDTNTRRTDLHVLHKYLLPPRLIPMFRRRIRGTKVGCSHAVVKIVSMAEFPQKISAQFRCCFLPHFMAQQEFSKPLLITFSYDLDLKGKGNQYNRH